MQTNERLERVNDYIDNLNVKHKFKFLSKVSDFIDEFGFDDIFIVIKKILDNQKLIQCLDSCVKNGEINISKVNNDYKTATFISLIDIYCDDKDIDFIQDDTSLDNEFLNNYADDNTKIYLREMGKHPLLLPEEEKELFLKLKNGDLSVKEKIIVSNLRLVVSIAKRYVGRGLQFLDLVQEGNTGLIKAVGLFDVDKGFKFSTYATWWIRQGITKAIQDFKGVIRIPICMQEKLNDILKTKNILYKKLGREPTNTELANELDMPLEKLEEILILNTNAKATSLNAYVGDEEDTELLDFVPDENNNLEETVFQHLSIDVIEDLIKKTTITIREKEVLFLRFGIEDGIPRTLEEVGGIYNVTRERIRQIESKALRKLRNAYINQKKKYDLDEKNTIDDEKLLKFASCNDFNKFDPSRINPKFDDNTSMGTWFVENMGFILKKEDITCKKIMEQYNEYKILQNKKTEEIELTKNATIREFRTGVNISTKTNKKVSDINVRRGDSYNNDSKENIRKSEIKEKEKMENKEENAFYSMFDGPRETVNQLIENNLSESQRNVVLKKWNNDLEKGEKVRGGFTTQENQTYSIAINKLKDWLVSPPKKRGRKKKDDSVKTNLEEKDNKKIQTKNSDKIDDITDKKIVSKKTVQANKENKTGVTKTNLDENEIFLKLYELINMPYFSQILQKFDPRDYAILFLKLNSPEKTIKEISDFTNIDETEIRKAFLKGSEELKVSLNKLIDEAFGVSDDEKKKQSSYKLD